MPTRTWNNLLYFDAMPGRKKAGRLHGDFEQWRREMTEHRIRTVVCLAPEEQIAAESPEYARWRQAARDAAGRYGEGYTLIDVPVPDFQPPEPLTVPRYRRAVQQVAQLIDGGEPVFIHCGAGIGRTGTFAVAVLMARGMDYETAYAEIDGVGSHPETPRQSEFLQRGEWGKTVDV